MISAVTRFVFYAVVITIFIPASVYAKTSIWKVSKGDDYFYLGGTFHLLSEADHPLPEEFLEAYADSQEVILETDMEAATSPAFQQKMMASMMFRDNKTLFSELEEETYDALKVFMAERQMPIEQFNMFQPWAVALILVLEEYTKLGMQPQFGVDAYFGGRGVQDEKSIQSLETVDEQLEFLSSLGLIDPDVNINYTLNDLENLPAYVKELKEGWREGDLEKLNSTENVVQLREEFPEVYSVLLTNRNKKWMSQLLTLFDDNAIEIVLVGALHLVGNDGLVALLKEEGFTLDQLE